VQAAVISNCEEFVQNWDEINITFSQWQMFVTTDTHVIDMHIDNPIANQTHRLV
jgi:hypothetical protein